jgi:hypothetical protein
MRRTAFADKAVRGELEDGYFTSFTPVMASRFL